MTSFFLKLCGLLAVGVFAFWWIGRGVWRVRRAESEVITARQAFSSDRHVFEKRLLEAARATGNPDDLTWEKALLLPSEPLLARDITTGELYALASIEVSFEAKSPSRQGTAVFIWRGALWTTEGRVVFDREPQQTLKRHSGSLAAV